MVLVDGVRGRNVVATVRDAVVPAPRERSIRAHGHCLFLPDVLGREQGLQELVLGLDDFVVVAQLCVARLGGCFQLCLFLLQLNAAPRDRFEQA